MEQFLLRILLPFMVTNCPVDKVSPVLYRGPDPHRHLICQLHDRGIKTIVSCRTNPQKRKARFAESLGMNFIQIPTGVFLAPREKEMNQFLKIVQNPANQPVYISCEVGTDRTSVYIGVYRVVEEHYTYEQACAEMEEHKLKHWWYAFRYYKDVVKEYADNPSLANKKANIKIEATENDSAEPVISAAGKAQQP